MYEIEPAILAFFITYAAYAAYLLLVMPALHPNKESSETAEQDEEEKDEAPQFIIRPRTTMVELGQSAKFHCSVSGRPKPSVTWDMNGERIISGGRYKIYSDDIDNHYLEINNIEETDLGTYNCTCLNVVGTVTAFANLQLAGDIVEKVEFIRQESTRLEKPEFIQELTDMEVTEHSDVKLTVRVREVFDEDKCAPVFLEKPRPWHGSKGQYARFSCKVDGVPLPQVEWSKDGEVIRPGGRYRIVRDGYSHAVEIPKVELSDEGRLTVTARNSQGEHSCTVSVQVYTDEEEYADYTRDDYYESQTTEVTQQDFRRVLKRHIEVRHKPEFVRELMDKYVREGDPVTFECIITGEPEPDIVWTVDGNEIRESDDFHMTYSDGIARLHIRKTLPEDEGEYKCTATNAAGHTSCVADLNVKGGGILKKDFSRSTDYDEEEEIHMRKQGGGLSAAKIEKGPGNVTIRRGKKVTIKVRFAGDPIPEVKWLKGDKELCAGGRISIETHNNLTKLIIRDVRPEDNDKYTLTVENSRGSDSCSTTLTVEDVPEAPVGQPIVSDIAANSCKLSWSPPVFDGGSAITGYTVELCKAKDKRWKVVKEGVQGLSYEVRRLQPETKYLFRVRAQNTHGSSEPSESSEPCTTLEGEEEWPYEPKHVVLQENTHIRDKYEIKEEIGKGRFSTVHKCVDKHTGKEYACKLINAIKQSTRKAVRDEIDTMNHLHHPKLLQATDGFSQGKYMAIVTELIPGGELLERITSPNYILTEKDCIIFMRQLCEALKHMHDEGYIHLDIKPENLLCIGENSTQVKLCDFNLSRKYKPGDQLKVMHGTAEFAAPEVVNYEPVETATDMWSVGVVSYALLSGLSPFAGDSDQETLSNVTKAKWDFDDSAFTNISNEGKDFIKKLLVKEPKKRLSASECLQHPWLAQDANRYKGNSISTDQHRKLLTKRKWQGEQLLQKPKFEKKMQDVCAKEGSSATFSVTVTGLPEPDVVFFQDGEIIEDDEKHLFTYEEDGTCSMTIPDVDMEDQDQYECTATNSVGEDKCTAQLTLEAAPGKGIRKKRPGSKAKKGLQEATEGPLMPTGPLRVTVLTKDSIEVDWQPPLYKKGAEPSHYIIEYRNLTLGEDARFLKLPADQTYSVFEELIENHRYFIGVAAENAFGVSDPLEVVVVIGQIGPREPDPSFTTPLEDQHVTKGQQAKFTVQIDKPGAKVKWLKDGDVIKSSNKYEIIDDEEENRHTLLVNNVDYDDEAVYTCMCGRRQSVADLIIVEPPASFTKELEDKEVMENNSVIFDCVTDQTSVKNVKWLKDGRRVQGDRFRTKVDKNRLSLTIKDATMDDMGVYTCKIEGTKSAAKLTVKPEPGFKTHLKDVEAVEKETIEMMCEVASEDMQVKWIKNNRPLRHSGRYEIFEDGCRRFLRIHDVSLDDNGTYFCQTGNKQTSCVANIEEAPVAEFLKKLENVTCSVGDVVILSCEVSIEDADVTWLKDGKQLKESEKYEFLKKGTMRQLKINDIVAQDRGRYVCQAGDNRTRADVNVEAPPRVYVHNKYQEEVIVNAEEPLQLEVDYEGYPPCHVSWIIEEEEIIQTRRIRIITTERKSQLAVKPAQRKDSGNYKCVVENEHGKEVVPIKVSVIDKPSKPNNLKVKETTRDSVTLTWDEPEDNGGSEINEYIIEKRDLKRQSFQNAGRTNDTEFTVSDLIEGNKYKFKVMAENRKGLGEPAETVHAVEAKDMFTEPDIPPGKPRVGNITPDSCSVSWQPPENDGGSPILGYIVEKRASYSPRWTKVNKQPVDDTHLKILDLIEGEEYEFRVSAVNKVGTGGPGLSSDIIVAQTCEMPPHAQVDDKFLEDGVQVKKGDTLILEIPYHSMPPPEVSWTVPVLDEERVKIEADEDKTVITIEDVLPEDAGPYKLKMKNPFGAEELCIPVTVIDTPEPPVDVRIIDINENKAVIEWDEPEDKGGADIIDYVVEVMDEDVQKWKKVTKTKQMRTVVEPLEEGHEYVFRVYAENIAGPSSEATESEMVQAKAVPAAPHALLDDKMKEEIKIKAGETLRLEVPFVGHPPPEVEWLIRDHLPEDKRKCTVDTTKGSTVLTVPYVKKADEGDYTVRLSNEMGEEVVPLRVFVLDKPSAPNSVQVTDVKKDNITIAWDEPESDGGCPIKGYTVEKMDEQTGRWETVTTTKKTEYTIPSLIEGHSYHFGVSAVNEVGASAPTETDEAIKAMRTPEPAKLKVDDELKQGVKLREGENLRLEIPFSGSPIPEFVFKKDGNSMPSKAKVTVYDDKAVIEVKRINTDDEGVYEINASNDLGDDSIEIPVSVVDKPGVPQNLEVPETTTDSVTLQWEEPEKDGGTPVTSYLIEKRDARRQIWSEVTSTPELTYKILGLIEGNKYHFRVSARNKVGTGEPVETTRPIVAKNMWDAPDAPAPPSISSMTTESCVVSWQPPKNDGGAPVTGYYLEKRAGYSPRWSKVNRQPINDTEFMVDDLIEDEEYEFRVAAENKGGVGEYSRPSERMQAKEHKIPPKIRIPKDMKDGVTVKKGDTLNVEVPFEGCPPPEIMWLYEEKPLPDDAVVSSTPAKTIMTIDAVSRKDAGEYKIQMANEFGADEAVIPVHVIEKPSSPCDVRVTEVSSQEAVTEWDRPEDDGGCEVLDFVVEVCDEDTLGDWKKVATTKDNKAVVPHLEEDHEYRIRVSAKNPAGQSKPTEIERPFIAQDKPMAPVLKVGNKYADGATFKAGQPIKLDIPFRAIPPPEVEWLYKGEPLESAGRVKIDTTKGKSALTVKDTERRDGGDFTIKISNELGEETYTVPVNVIDKPSAPAEVQIKAISAKDATAEWKAPEENGGCEITDYIVDICDEESPNRWKNVTKTKDISCNIPNLQEDHDYRVRVVAQNEMGRGPPKESNVFTAADKPMAPELKVDNKYAQGATVKAGQPIKLDIPFRAIPGAEVQWEYNGEPLEADDRVKIDQKKNLASLTVNKSKRDDKGDYTVKLSNELGENSFTVPVNVIDKPSEPAEIRIKAISAKDATAEWDAPTDDGGCEILDFIVEICDEDTPDRWKQVTKTKEKSCNIPNLKEDHEYKVRVAAENEIGKGPTKETTAPFAAVDKPMAPEFKVGDKYADGYTIRAGQPIKLDVPFRAIPPAEVEWLYNGEELDKPNRYKVENSKAKSIITVRDTKRVDDKGEYTIKLKNDLGEKTYTVDVNVIDKPGAPKDVRVMDITPKDAIIEWDEPEDDGGIQIIDFVVEVCDMDNPERWKQVTKTKERTCKVPSLKEDHEYKVRVSAQNEMGRGPPTESVSMVAQDKPMAPELKIGDKFKDGATFTAGEPVKLDIPFRAIPTPEIEWEYNGKPIAEDNRTKFESSRSKAALTVGNSMRADTGDYTIKLKNELGEKTYTVNVKVIDKPSPPASVNIKDVSAKEATAEWGAPEDDGGCEILDFIVEICDEESPDKWHSVSKTKNKSCHLPNLKEDHEYRVRVSAENKVGQGKPAEAAKTFIAADKPMAPVVRLDDKLKNGLTVKRGDTISLDVTYRAVPPPQASWEFNGKPVKDDARTKVNTKKDKSALTVKDARRSDKGDYLLKLKNEEGEGSVTIPVNVIGKPDPPTDLKVSDVTQDSVSLAWKPPNDDGGTPLTGYIVDKRKKDSDVWVKVTITKDTKAKIPDLEENCEYFFRIKAKNEMGESEQCVTDQATLIKKPPAPPKLNLPDGLKDGIAVHGGDTIKFDIPFTGNPPPEVTWLHDGKEIKADKDTRVEKRDDHTTLTLHGAKREDKGNYTVKVKNSEGSDSAAIPVNVLTKPKKPKDLTVSDITDLSVVLHWKKPDDDGGSDITAYIVERRDATSDTWVKVPMASDPKVATQADLKIKVPDLQESHEYYFRVSAANKIGTSEPVETKDRVLTKKPPAPPKIEVPEDLKGGISFNGGDTLELTIPFDGNPPPTITWFKDGKELQPDKRIKIETKDDKTTLSIPHDAVREDMGEYKVKVKNDLGEDTTVIPVTVIDRPKAPTNLKCTDIQADNVTLEWSKPTDDGGSEITGYIIEKNNTKDGPKVWEKVYATKATNGKVLSLIENDEYYFRVCATNKIGSSDPIVIGPIKVKKPRVAPKIDADKYKDGVEVRGGNTLLLEIDFTGNPPPEITWTKDGKELKPNSHLKIDNEEEKTVLTIPEAERGDLGKYGLKLKNELGEDAVQIPVNVVDKPSSPKDLKVTDVREDRMTLTWKEPDTDNGAPITGYIIEKQDQADGEWKRVVTVKDTKYTVPDLKEGHMYHFRVSAENRIGASVPLQTQKATKAERPPAPPDVELDAKYLEPIMLKGGETLDIEIPYTGNPDPSVVWEFNNQAYKADGRTHMDHDANVAKLQVKGVRRNDTGTYMLKLKNEHGKKDVPVKVIVIDHPKPPRDLKVVQVLADSITISWREPEEDGGSPVTGYVIDKAGPDGMDWEEITLHTDLNKLQFKVPSLIEGNEYYFRVVARNKIGDSMPIKTDQPIKAERPPAPPDCHLDAKYKDGLTLRRGETLSIDVPYSGKPDPSVNWQMGTYLLNPELDDRLVIDNTDFIAKLVLKDCRRADGGTYTLKLKNTLGTKDASIKVTVLDVPGPPSNLKAANIMSESITLRWMEPDEDGGCPITAYILEKAGINKDDWEECGIAESLGFKVKDLTEGQQYHFRVRARNEVGDGEPVETAKPIKAERPPAPPDYYLDAKYLGVITLKGGETLSLEIPYSGKPDPEVTWSHNGKTLQADDRTTIDNSEFVARLTVENVNRNDSGVYKLGLFNSLGSKECSVRVNVIDKPKPPRDLKVTNVQAECMTLRWREPEDDCGSPITGYLVEKVEKDGLEFDEWSEVATVTNLNHTVPDLVEGEEYFFRVRAINDIGMSEPEQTLKAIRAAQPPAPPSAYLDNNVFEVEEGDELVIEVPFDGFPVPDVQWVMNGRVVEEGDPIAIAEVTPQNVAILTIPEIRKADAGNYQLRLKNQLGRETVPIQVAVLGKPGSPDNLTVTGVSEDSVGLRWQRPRDNGGSPIKGYKIEKQQVPGEEWEYVDFVHDTAYTVPELTEGNEYFFRVSAVNKYGESPPTRTVDAALCKSPWERPEYTLGAEHKRPVYIAKGEILHLDIPFFGNPEPECTWTLVDTKDREHMCFDDWRTNIHQHYHLHDKPEYIATIIRSHMEKKDEGTYWLHLQNLAGEERIPIEVVVMDVPSPPRDLKVVGVSAEAMTIRWKPPEDDGGNAVAGYMVEKMDTNARTWRRVGFTADLTMQVPELIEGFTYTFRVSAENQIGFSDPCEMHKYIQALNDFVEPGPPSMPEIFDVRPTSCILEWDPPADDGGSPIIEYIVERKQMTATRWGKAHKQPVTETHLEATGLSEGAEYEFRVTAVNAAGPGKPSPSSGLISIKSPFDPPGIPGHPEIVTVNADGVELEWMAPKRDGGKPVTGYIVEQRQIMSRNWTPAKTGPVPNTNCMVTGLEGGTEYVFRVIAVNDVGQGKPSQASKSVITGEAPSVEQPLKDCTVVVGKSLKLQCKIVGEPSPEIKWFKDGRECFDGRKYHLKNRGSVAILQVDKSYQDTEEGKFTCSASNELGSVKTSCHVTVIDKPKPFKRQGTMTIGLDDFIEMPEDEDVPAEQDEFIAESPSRIEGAAVKPSFKRKLNDIDCLEGGAVKFTCVVTGIPDPEVTWMKNGLPVEDCEDYRYIVDGESYSLIIREVFPMDAGLYTVKAANIAGSVACDAVMTVEGEDEEDTDAPRFRKLMKDCEVDEDDTAQFTVRVTGRPQPEISWFINGVMIQPDNRKYYVTEESGLVTLTIKHCTPEDVGNYSCTAVNEAGSISCHADLIVNPTGRVHRKDEPEYPPEFLEEIEDLTVAEGEPVMFTCRFQGNPEPEMQWFKNGRYLSPTQDMQVKVVGDYCKFTIREAFPEDCGTYTCQITNPLGQAATSAILEVIEEAEDKKPQKMAPRFAERLHDLETFEGNEVTFTCKVTGIPRPDVIWYFDGKRIAEQDPHYSMTQKGFRYNLTVHKASSADEAEYTCKARNSEGTDFSAAELTVIRDTGERKPKGTVPSFSKKIRDSEVMEGGQGMLDVKVAPDLDYDELKIQWFKDSDEIFDDGHFETISGPHGHFSLMIHNATLDDRGQYMCTVTNPAGKASCVADIIVDVIGGRLVMRRRGEDEDDFGQRKVKFSEEPPPTPSRPEISNMRDTSCYLSWRPLPFKAGQPITYIVEYREAGARNWRLMKQGLKDSWYDVTGLHPNTDYMFRIRAENMFGVSDPSLPAQMYRVPDHSGRKADIASLEIDNEYGWDVPPKPYVESPPMLRGPEENLYAAEHQQAKIGMFIYGWPKPEVQWYFNGKPIEMEGRYHMHWEKNSHHVLCIDDFRPEDVGDYQVVASNEYGQCAKTVCVELAEPPCFIEPLTDKTFIERWGGTLDCRVDGIPYPEIKWFKDWHPIVSSERQEIQMAPPDGTSLVMRHAIMRDEGMYTVVAKNLAGEVACSCNIEIIPEPLDYINLDMEIGKKIEAKRLKCNDFYDVVGELGSGDFSEVKKVVERQSGREFAAKFIDCPEGDKEAAAHELKMMTKLHHGNIPTLHDAFESKNAMVIVEELCDGGHVVHRLADKEGYTEAEVALYMKQLLDAVKYMHSKNIAHLDLKPENVMLHHLDSPEVKLIDFGNTQQIKIGEDVTVDRFDPEYAAPEVMDGKNVGCKADCWSLGAIAYTLLSGLSPFLGDTPRDTMDNVRSCDWDFDPFGFKDISGKARDFISRLLVTEPELRMSASEAANHPFIKFLDPPDFGEKLDAEQLRNFHNRRRDGVDKTALRVAPDHWDIDMKLSENEGFMLKHFPWKSYYQQGPDTALVQYQDPDYMTRVRGYMEDTMWSWRWFHKGLLREKSKVAAHERRRIMDMEEEMEDDKGISSKVKISNLAMRRRLKGEGHAPVFKTKLKDMSFQANKTVVLKCVVVGNPLPNVSWFRNEERLTAGGPDMEMNLTIDGVASLMLVRPSQFCAGVYKCIARNEFGDAVCRARLRLGEMPDAPSRPQVVQIAPNEAYLEWDAPKFDGNSDIEVYRVDYRQPRDDRWTMFSDSVQEEFVVVKGLHPNSVYRFRVSCKNQFGWGNYSFSSVEVRTPLPGEPKLKLERNKAHAIREAQQNKYMKVLSGIKEIEVDSEFKPVPLQEGDPENSYVFRENIFSGRFSVVHKSLDTRDQSLRAAKIFHYSSGNRSEILQEYENMRRLRHERIINLEEAFLTSNYLILIMENIQGGELLKYICWRDEYTEELCAKIIRQVLDALQYMHFFGMAYLNLQPDNILMVSRRLHSIKLIDFGTARTLRNPSEGDEGLEVDCPLDFMSPEVANYEPVSLQADVWGIGVLTFLLLSGVSPFRGDDEEETLDNVTYVRYDHMDFYRNISKEAFRFVTQALRRNPSKRMSIEECFEHRWLQLTDIMTRQREKTVFLTNKLRTFTSEYNTGRRDMATRSHDLLHAYGSLTRASSVDTINGFA